MLDLSALDVDEIATALSDQTDYEHRWLIDPRTGEIAFWTSDTGIDGENPIDLDELDLLPIDPLPSQVWYADMADFVQQVSVWQGLRDARAQRRAIGWLLDQGLISKAAAENFTAGHPDPVLP
jgi:hypothetical protein